jgi:hypothetical protein
MCAAVTIVVWNWLEETKGNGNGSVVMCAVVTVMVWYMVGETGGNGKDSLVMGAAVTHTVCFRVRGVKIQVLLQSHKITDIYGKYQRKYMH